MSFSFLVQLAHAAGVELVDLGRRALHGGFGLLGVAAGFDGDGVHVAFLNSLHCTFRKPTTRARALPRHEARAAIADGAATSVSMRRFSCTVSTCPKRAVEPKSPRALPSWFFRAATVATQPKPQLHAASKTGRKSERTSMQSIASLNGQSSARSAASSWLTIATSFSASKSGTAS